MFMRYLNLAIHPLHSSQSVPSQPTATAWLVSSGTLTGTSQPEDGYPIINFNDTNVNSEVVFKYNYTGTLSANKYFGVQLFENDCSTGRQRSPFVHVNNTDGDVLNIDLDIVQETITNPAHYNEITAAEAAISFCSA
jgi:hypothetical protein